MVTRNKERKENITSEVKESERSRIDELLTIVIPTLNEAEAIGKVLDELFKAGIKPEQVLVVDGHSTDKTPEIAASKGVKVIFQEGKGKGDALKSAVKHVKTPYVLVMDGDYTYPATHIPALLEKALRGGFDEVIGARVYGRKNIPLLNRVGNKVLTAIFNSLFGVHLKDLLSGMYLVRTERLREIEWVSRGFSIEAEVAAHVISTTGRIAEVPIKYRKRRGKKKLRVLDGVRILLDSVRLAWRYNPAFFIFTLGSLTLIPGLALGCWLLYLYLARGVKRYFDTIISVTLISTGFISLILAILALYLKRMEVRILRRLDELVKLSKS